jgi:hypothetical protein
MWSRPSKYLLLDSLCEDEKISIHHLNRRCCGPITSPAAVEVPQNQATDRGTGNEGNHPILQWDAPEHEPVD